MSIVSVDILEYYTRNYTEKWPVKGTGTAKHPERELERVQKESQANLAEIKRI